MTLSDLKNNEIGIITKVRGRGAFRRRVMEMGFIKGKTVQVIKAAPLDDPVQYRIMDYEVSLRRSEAALIEVITPEEIINLNITTNIDNLGNQHRKRYRGGKQEDKGITEDSLITNDFNNIDDDRFKNTAIKESKIINIALVGNPNAGKTTFFNYASNSHERVGNYCGITIEAKTSEFEQDGYIFKIIDLPGTYSLSAYSPEELYIREFILDKFPDIIINIVDATNIERNLYLTTQLIDMDVKVIMALNMYDELEKRGDILNYEALGNLLGIPIIPTISSKGIGIKELFQKAIEVYEDNSSTLRHIHINYGQDTEKAIKAIQKTIKIKENEDIVNKYSSRFLAIKLLEKDKDGIQRIAACKNKEEILDVSKQQIHILENLFQDDTESIITDARYGFINGAIKETLKRGKINKHKTTEFIDYFLTHRILGFPIFLFFMWIMFQATFKIGSYPMTWINDMVKMISHIITNWLPDGILKDLIVDGVLGGVGGVIIFLPNILILFFFISLMEDLGYMARTAFIMDKLMHKIGLHGKSFIPIIMGFGCNVPAVMATRTLENRSDRLLTMLIIPFMSCSARLPIYILIIGAFFPSNPGTILFLIYMIGIIIATIVAIILRKTLFRNKEVPFVMELPPYRIPTLKSTVMHMWHKGREYLKKMGGIILAASIIIWALNYFPRTTKNTEIYNNQIKNIENTTTIEILHSKNDIAKNKIIEQKNKEITKIELQKKRDQQEHSFIGTIGKAIEPIIKPLGFDWRIGVSLITGAMAKEIVISTLNIMYQIDNNNNEPSGSLQEKIKEQNNGGLGLNAFTAFGFILFVMLYIPCIATIIAIKQEAGHIKWALLLIAYSTSIAWIAAFIVKQLQNIILLIN
jgi:ferrous iron transport protein B